MLNLGKFKLYHYESPTFNMYFFIITFFFSCQEDDILDGNDLTTETNKLSSKNGSSIFCVESTNKFDFSKADYVETRPDFLWGINGHSLTKEYGDYDNQYMEYSQGDQIDILKELNVGIYRTDIHVNEYGIWNEDADDFENLLDLLNANEIEMLPVIFTNPWRDGEVLLGDDWNFSNIKKYVNSSNAGNIQSLDVWNHYYSLGDVTGSNFADEYGAKLKYYHVGNEIAYYIIKNYRMGEAGGSPLSNEQYFFTLYGGDDISDFFKDEEHAKRTIASAAYVKGFIDGARQNDSNGAEFVVNGTRIDFGYFKFLNLMGVGYDIIGWNWYSDFGDFNDMAPGHAGVNTYNKNVYGNLVSIGGGKPIWITEFNKTLGSKNGEFDQAVKIHDFMQQMYNFPNVKAFLVYELIDQKYSEPPTNEDYFGLIRSPFTTGGTHKPAFNTYRFSIEEFKYGYHDFMYAYYLNYKGENRNLLAADPNGMDYWAGILSANNGSNLNNVLNNILDGDSDYFIKTTFIDLLDRNASENDVNNYRNNIINQIMTREGVLKNLGSSTEFFNKAQTASYNNYSLMSSSVKFVRHAYIKLINEYPESTELNAALAHGDLTNQTNRGSVIMDILNSDKYKEKFINEQFDIYLERDPSGGDITNYITNWPGQKSLIKALLMSDEFWRLSVVKGYCIRQN